MHAAFHNIMIENYYNIKKCYYNVKFSESLVGGTCQMEFDAN
jgi:hypothetical protein